MEIGIIVFVQHSIDDGVLQLFRCLVALEDLEDE